MKKSHFSVKRVFSANFYNIENFVKKTIKIRLNFFYFSLPRNPPGEFAVEHSSLLKNNWSIFLL